VIFATDSKLRRLESEAFAECSFLRSFWVASSVEFLPQKCFWSCVSLQQVSFGTSSKLNRIESEALASCTSLSLMIIPNSVEILFSGCFRPFRELERATGTTGTRTHQRVCGMISHSVRSNELSECPANAGCDESLQTKPSP
jgi:hypothetical protein